MKLPRFSLRTLLLVTIIIGVPAGLLLPSVVAAFHEWLGPTVVQPDAYVDVEPRHSYDAPS